jgi:diguanylate cyclase (GGDEF)-like protein
VTVARRFRAYYSQKRVTTPVLAAALDDPGPIALLALAGFLALLVGVLITLLLRRSGGVAETRVTTVLAEMEARMEAMVAELTAALRRAEDELRRTRALAELSGSIDLDQVLENGLRAALELAAADAGLVYLAGGDEGRPVVTTVGLSREEAERQGMIAGPPDGRIASSVSFRYRYPDELAADPALLRAGVAAPLICEDGPIGFLAVFMRGDGRPSDEQVRELEEIAGRAAPAIDNARRFREARQLAELDALTGLHNRRYFHETLGREVARAHRYRRRLALIVLDLDDFKAVNDRIGHLAGDAALAEAAARMRTAVRSSDVPCRVGGDEFAVICPESNLADAEQLCRRVQEAVSAQPLAQAGVIKVSAGVAELQTDEDARAFFQRADDALYRAKESGRGHLVEAGSGSRAVGTP